MGIVCTRLSKSLHLFSNIWALRKQGHSWDNVRIHFLESLVSPLQCSYCLLAKWERMTKGWPGSSGELSLSGCTTGWGFSPLLQFSPHYHQGMILWTKSGRVSSTVSAVILSFLWCMRLHLSYWVLLGICSERLMANLHAVSSAGSGSSHGFLPGLTLHFDFMMCLKKKVNCFWGNHYWYLFHQNTYLGTAPLSVEGGCEASSV